MFCQHCGLEYTQKTKYCKRCGANLNSSDKTPMIQLPGLKVTGLFIVIAAFVLIGMMMLFNMGWRMMSTGIDEDVMRTVIIPGALTIGVVALLLIRQLSRVITVARKQADQAANQEQPTFIEVQPQANLPAPADPIRNAVESPSVAEHTTRQMAGVYRGPNAPK